MNRIFKISTLTMLVMVSVQSYGGIIYSGSSLKESWLTSNNINLSSKYSKSLKSEEIKQNTAKILRSYHRLNSALVEMIASSPLADCFGEEINKEVKEIKEALKNEFDINARFEAIQSSLIEVIFSELFYIREHYEYNFDKCFINFTSSYIQILDQLFESDRIFINAEKIMQSLTQFLNWHHASHIFDRYENFSYINSYAQNYLDKILKYSRKIINDSAYINITVPSFYDYDDILCNELETMIKDKKNNFITSFVSNINTYNFKALDALLSLYNKEDLNLFYERERTILDQFFLTYIPCNAFRKPKNNVSRYYAHLMQMIAYLKHNSIELSICRMFKDEFFNLYYKKIDKNQYKNASKKYKYFFKRHNGQYDFNEVYDFLKLILENGSSDELLCFFPNVDYLSLVSRHFLSFYKALDVEDLDLYLDAILGNKAFIISNPEYNPISIALNAKNYKMAYYFIYEPYSLLRTSELIKLSHLHKNPDATVEEILAFDMSAVNFNNFFINSINCKSYDIAYTILDSFSDDINQYSDLTRTTKESLAEIYMNVLTDLLVRYDLDPSLNVHQIEEAINSRKPELRLNDEDEKIEKDKKMEFIKIKLDEFFDKIPHGMTKVKRLIIDLNSKLLGID